jgi:integrase
MAAYMDLQVNASGGVNMAKVNFTVGRVADFACPKEKAQAFLWDSKAPGLGLRVTSQGARAYIFQSRLRDGQSVRLTIGEPMAEDGRGVYTIPNAQEQARRLQRLIDEGKDPRLERAAQTASDRATRDAAKAGRQRLEVTGLMAWEVYCAERKPHWSARNHADHLSFASEGGKDRKRAKGKTVAGPLRPLLAQPLAEIDAAAVQSWVTRETKTRPARALLGFRLLRAFLNWCAESEGYQHLARPDACKGRRTREKLGKTVAKSDALQREQLAAWFAAVRADSNLVAAAYLQTLLLTGSRREELAGLRWVDVDFQWKALRIRDKVEGERVIPLTPYVAHLLSWLPHRPNNPFVFTSPTAASGRLQEARPNHVRALKVAGLPHITLHGLRRSFGTLSEWVEVPVGIVAQIQGHKPSAIAEKHYRVRPLDLLRMWHERIESWVLSEAGVEFKPKAEDKPALRVVTSA